MLVSLALLASSAGGAVLTTETFTGGLNGWDSRDAVMPVTHDGNDYAIGTFGSQVFPVPQTDAFIINTGTDFLGSYAGINQIQFWLRPVNVLPSDLFFYLVSGGDYFYQQISTNAMAVNGWNVYTVNLLWSHGWQGDSESAFNTALGNVTELQIQLTRGGSLAQQIYQLDNVQTLYDENLEELGGGAAVPEPGALGLWLQGGIILLAIRRQMVRDTRLHRLRLVQG